MTSAVGDAAALTDLLAKHEWHQPEGYESIWYRSAHAKHDYYYRCAICTNDLDALAQLLAGYVTTAQAQAWDNGVDTAGQYAEQPWVVDDECKPLNPYREASHADD